MKKLDGSFTVEAAFVTPIILYILFAILYLTFYLYDEVMIDSYMVQAFETYTRKGIYSIDSKENKEDEKKIKTYLEDKLKDKTMIVEIEKIEVDAKLLKYVIKVTYHMGISLKGSKNFFQGEYKSKEKKIEKMRNCPSEFLRLYIHKGIDATKEEEVEKSVRD